MGTEHRHLPFEFLTMWMFHLLCSVSYLCYFRFTGEPFLPCHLPHMADLSYGHQWAPLCSGVLAGLSECCALTGSRGQGIHAPASILWNFFELAMYLNWTSLLFSKEPLLYNSLLSSYFQGFFSFSALGCELVIVPLLPSPGHCTLTYASSTSG